MNILVISAAGFIGTNLLLRLSSDSSNAITATDDKINYFNRDWFSSKSNIKFVEASFSRNTDFDSLLKGQDIVFHLASTTIPATSNSLILEDVVSNIEPTISLLDACIRQRIKKVVFMSSGGTVYGKTTDCPIKETDPTDPISSYGIQKLSIEKLLGLYHSLYGLDYVAVRLSNPYGPYQRPDGRLGVVTTFVFRALNNQPLSIYGDGSVVRDFIYIDDAINMIYQLAFSDCKYHVYNVGSGVGVSIMGLIETIRDALNLNPIVTSFEARNADVPINYLDISRYEREFNPLRLVSLKEGIRKTALFLAQP